MEVYKNSFDKNEDMMLWELHEIRHELHKEITQKSVEQINREALKEFQEWQRRRVNKAA
jgi:hypothetical protein